MNSSAPKAANESAVDHMIRTVKDWIGEGVYKSGDRLPSETELCRIIGISRGSVREAMKILSALGLVDVRRGNGTFIPDQNAKPLVEPLLLSLKRSKWSVKDFMDFREQIEKSVVELIIRNASDEEIALLEQANRRMKDEIDGNNDIHVLIDADIAFHREMARCTKNSLFEILYSFSLDFILSDIERIYQESASMGYISYLLHQHMVDSMLRRDLAAAKDAVVQAMKNHERAGSALPNDN